VYKTRVCPLDSPKTNTTAKISSTDNIMKFLAFLFSVASVLMVVEGMCADQIKVQITPTMLVNQIQNFTVDLALWKVIDVGRGGPRPGGTSQDCGLECTTARIGYSFKSTKQLTQACGNFVDHWFDTFQRGQMRKQWYISAFDVTENGTTGLFNPTSMTIMVISRDNVGKPL
jgi:hypothetical protein